MKLDFSALTQPTSKERGQTGTTGTPASMRVAPSPAAGDTLGTSGDTARRVRPGLDSSAAAPVVCPPLSPPCPQSLGTCKPSAYAVSPVSPVVPTESDNCAARTGIADWTRTGQGSKTGATHASDQGANAEPVADTRKAETDASPLPDLAMEARRQRVLAMLADRPGTRYAMAVHNPDADPVIVALAILDVGTCELAIPAAKFDAFALLALIERHDATVH